jgi:hypothetical protein
MIGLLVIYKYFNLNFLGLNNHVEQIDNQNIFFVVSLFDYNLNNLILIICNDNFIAIYSGYYKRYLTLTRKKLFFQLPVSPIVQMLDKGNQLHSGFAYRIFYLWRHFMIYFAGNQFVILKLP